MALLVYVGPAVPDRGRFQDDPGRLHPLAGPGLSLRRATARRRVAPPHGRRAQTNLGDGACSRCRASRQHGGDHRATSRTSPTAPTRADDFPAAQAFDERKGHPEQTRHAKRSWARCRGLVAGIQEAFVPSCRRRPCRASATRRGSSSSCRTAAFRRRAGAGEDGGRTHGRRREAGRVDGVLSRPCARRCRRFT